LTTSDAQHVADQLRSASLRQNWTVFSLPGYEDVSALHSVGGQPPYQDWFATAIVRMGIVVVAINADGTSGDVERVLGELIPVVRNNLSQGLVQGSQPAPYSYGH
jgi:hypothetical protein